MSATVQDLAPLFQAEPPRFEVPDWFVATSREALELARELAAPKRTDETWRFGQLGQLMELASLAPAEEFPDAEELRGRDGDHEVAARFVFANDRLLRAEVPAEWAGRGLVVADLERAMREHPELLQTHFANQAVRLGTDQFAALHRARVRGGLFVHVPAGQRIEGTIEVTHWIGGENVCGFPHTLIVAGADSRVEVLEQFRSADGGTHGLIGMVDLVAERGAELTYAAAQRLNRNSRMLQFQTVVTGERASAKALALHLGSAWSRQQSYSRLVGEGGRADMLAAVVASGDQSFDSRTLQVHESPGATSDLLYKNALFDRARSVFSGLIVVEPGAHETDAYQTCRNLLNSNEAEAHSLPGLEIHADRVACSHGATSGQIEEEELFYLLARGIPEDRARHLIARGFLADVLERLGDTPLRARLEGLIEEGLQAAES